MLGNQILTNILTLLSLITIPLKAQETCTVTFYSGTTYGSGTKYGPYTPGDVGASTERGYMTLPNDGVRSMRIDVPNGADCAVVICEHHLIGYNSPGVCPRYETDTSQTYNDIGSFGVSSFSLRDITGYTFNPDLACAGRNELGVFDRTAAGISKSDMFAACKSECDNEANCVSFEWYTFTTSAHWSDTYSCVLSETCTTEVATDHANLADRNLDLYEKIEVVVQCPKGGAQSFDWDTLTTSGTGKPDITYTINVDESANTDLALNIEVRVPYITRTKADDQLTAKFGTTYVLDFEDFDAHKSKISEPNSCSNRLASSYEGLTDNQNFQILSQNFYAIGSDENMCYPTPGGESVTGWDIDYDASDCNTIVYKGRWEWGSLRECRNNANALTNPNGQQTFIPKEEGDPHYDPNYLTLSGTFYVNVVSPFWNEDNDLYGNYYRVYQLLSQPFVIQVSTSVYVIGSTGVNVMTMSIIAVYKEDQDTDYTLILLTEAAEYMQLINGQIIQVPTSTQFSLIMQSTDESNGCLNNKAYLCSQLWKITATDTTCNVNRDDNGNGGINFSGEYILRFTPQCRAAIGGYDSETHCNNWLDAHPIFKNDGNGIALSTQLTFVDGICETKTFTVQLEASMKFYEDDQYSIYIDPDTSSHLYQVGEDTVYGKITLNFPTDTETIFDSQLINVWLCTFPPEIDAPDPDMNGQSGGCFSDLRDGFNDGNNFFFHVYEFQQDPPLVLKAEENFIVNENGYEGNDVIRFKFTVPYEIQRDTLYIHAQVEVLLEQPARRRRRMLLNVNVKGKTTNKISHFGKNIGITNKRGNEPKQLPQEPISPIKPIQQPPLTEPFTISLTSTWIIIIGGLLSIVLLFNIIFMCYVNCCKGNNGTGTFSFDKRRRSGYDSVKHVDSEEFDDSEANLINVN